jgi:nucleotide-binding universal stress UspA family protein
VDLKDLLVCFDSTDAGESRLKLAVQLARRSGAFLTAAYVLEPANRSSFQGEPVGGRLPQGADWFGGGAAVAEAPRPDTISSGVMRAERAEERFREALRIAGLDGDWRLIDGPDTAEVAALARTADLAILGQYVRDANGIAFRPDDVAMVCGRPLLIVPYIGGFTTVGEVVLIAWDGTREATRAFNDALPLIEAAKNVTVMTVLAQERDFERSHIWLQRMVAHLDRHGIPARAEETVRGDLSISDVLLSRAADLGADLIVAGAYHHSPLREALLGGVSRELLQHMTVPLLMSH